MASVYERLGIEEPKKKTLQERLSITPVNLTQRSNPQMPTVEPRALTGYERFKDQTFNPINPLASGMANVNIGVLNTLRTAEQLVPNIAAKAESFVTGKDLAPRQGLIYKGLTKAIENQEQAKQPYEENIAKLTGLNKYASGAIQSLPQVLPALTGASQVSALGAIGSTAFGSQARESEKQGANYLQQVASGIGSAGTEIATEALPIQNILKFVKGKGQITDLIKNVGQEFLGEATAQAMQPFIDSAYNRTAVKDAYTTNIKQTSKDILDAGLTGSLSALLLGGSAMGINTVKAINNPTPQNIEEVVTQIEQVTQQPIDRTIIQESIKKPTTEPINQPIQSIQPQQQTASINAIQPQKTDIIQPKQNTFISDFVNNVTIDLNNKQQVESEKARLKEIVDKYQKDRYSKDAETRQKAKINLKTYKELYDKLLRKTNSMDNQVIDNNISQPQQQTTSTDVIQSDSSIAKNAPISIDTDITDSYSGQINVTKNAKINGKIVGKLDYTVYDDKPFISMVEVDENYRRKGIATQLITELQKEYPNSDIEWGGTTEDGTALQKAITEDVPIKEIQDKLSRIKKLKENISIIETKDYREVTEEEGDKWNEWQTELDILNRETIGQSLTKKVLKSNNKQPEPYVVMNEDTGLSQQNPPMPTSFSSVSQEGTRKTYGNTLTGAVESGVINQEVLDTMPEEAKTYIPTSNEVQWAYATDKVNTNPTSALSEFMTKDKLGNEGKDTAVAEALIKKFSDDGNFQAASDVATKLTQLATEAAQAIQAISILKRLTPEGMLYYANKQVNEINKELDKKIELTEAEQKEIYDIMKDVQENNIDGIKQRLIDKGLTDKQVDSIDTDKITEIGTKLALQTIANKLPSTFTEKQQAIRRMAMLLNPKTQVRNFVGNAIMGTAENASQVISANLDKAISLITGERKTLSPQIKAQIQGAIKGFKDALIDYKLGIDTTASGGGALEVGQSRQVFKNKALNDTNNFLSFIMTLGDRPFYQAAYNQRIVELEQIGVKIDDDAKLQAHEFALDRVFQNDTEISKAMSEVKRTLNRLQIVKGFGLGDMALPFTKTPANILRKGVQYTPLGLVANLKAHKGGFDQKLFTDSVARSMVGSSIMTLGYLLAKAGLATGDYDKNKNKESAETLAGETNYSFKIGDKYYSFDWAQPISIPLAVGIDFYRAKKSEDDLLNAIKTGIISGGQTLFNQSLLQGVTRMFGGYNPTQGLLDTVANAPSQYIPTILGQTARTIDPYVRDTDVPFGKTLSKLPLARQTLPKKLDVFGEPIKANQGRGLLDRALENFFLPNTISKKTNDPLVKELLELSKTTDTKDFLPKLAPKTFENNGTVTLTKEEQQKYQETIGKLNYKLMTDLINNSKYDALSDEEKVNLLRKLNEQNANKAKKIIIENRK